MKHISVGKHVVPLWAIGIALIGLCLGTYALYTALTFTIPLQVSEPLEVLHYPSSITLYPGETLQFNVTLQNHASRNYTVVLAFSLDNSTYQNSYVNFSASAYLLQSGVQDLAAWLKVSSDAPPANAALRVDVQREASNDSGQQTTVLYKENVYWNSTDGKTYITIGNAGTENCTITRLYVGTSATSLLNVTASTNIGNGLVVDAASDVLVTLSWPNSLAPMWTGGSCYYFKVITDSGQVLGVFPEQAPEDVGSEQIIFTSSVWGLPGTTTIPSFLFKVKNVGTVDSSITEIRVDGIGISTHNVTLPYFLAKGSEVAINITRTFTRGASYQFSVQTLRSNTFGPYTATAP